MDFIAALDPELAPAIQALPNESSIDWNHLPAARAEWQRESAQAAALLGDIPGVTKEDATVPGTGGGPPVPIRIYRPTGARDRLPCLIYIHGGGMVSGSVAEAAVSVRMVADRIGALRRAFASGLKRREPAL